MRSVSIGVLYNFHSIVLSNAANCDYHFRFVPDKEFSGTDRSQKREGPVQFEKDDDIFGLTFLEFLEDAKRGEKRSSDDRRHDRKRDRKE